MNNYRKIYIEKIQNNNAFSYTVANNLNNIAKDFRI